jgi:outer membrane protein OmpA-like peptidoglycan-associated protein
MTRPVLLSLALLLVTAVSARAQEEAPDSGASAAEEAPPLGARADVTVTGSTQAGPRTSGPRVGRMPSLYGHTGLFHLLGADSTPAGTFTLGLFGELFTGSDVVRAGDENTRVVGRLGLSYTPHPNVEVFGAFSALGNTSNFSDPELIQSQGDLRLGVKGFAPFAEGWAAGGALTAMLPTGSNDVGFNFSATSMDFRGFLTWDLASSADVPLLMHTNLAYYFDNSARLFKYELQRVERFAHQVSDFDLFEVGLGAEVPLDYVTPFLEWRLGLPIGPGDERACSSNPIPCPRDAGFGSFPHVLTLGVKGTPLPGLALNLGVDIGLSTEEATGLPGTPPYNVLFGVAYLLDPTPAAAAMATDARAAGPTGWILGEVVDSETGEPVAGALVSYPGTDFTSQSTGLETGRFRSYELPPDTEVTVEVTHPEFEGRAFTRVIREGEDAVRIRLERRQDLAVLAGRVVDRAGSPVAASIHVAGRETRQFEADPLESTFEEQLPIGRYVLTITAANHVSERRVVELAPGQAQLEITLEPRPSSQVAVLRGDRIELEGAQVTFIDNGAELQMTSEGVLDQVAELMRAHPDLALRVVAHSDDRGSVEVTQQQAERVVEYLVDVGIEARRLSAEGAGGERPRYPNITERNRQRNWRVEFLFR